MAGGELVYIGHSVSNHGLKIKKGRLELPSTNAEISASGDILINPGSGNSVTISGSVLPEILTLSKIKTTGNVIGSDVKIVDFTDPVLQPTQTSALKSKPAWNIAEFLEKMVVTQDSTTFLDFETITTEGGDIVVQNELSTAVTYDDL